MSVTGKDIIIFSVIRWDQPLAGSAVAVAKELSKNNRVFFVDRPFSLRDLFKDYESFSLRKRLSSVMLRKNPFMEVQTGFSSFVVCTPGLTLPINFLPEGWLFNVLNTFNSLVVKWAMKRMAKQYAIKDYIYINYFNPVLLPTLEIKGANNHLNIYYITQDIRLSKYMSRHGFEAENRLLPKTDLVLVSSKNQFKRLFNESPRMHYFPNAVDYDLFSSIRDAQSPPPRDLDNVGSTKIIMFCGYLSEVRIDYKLLKLTCEYFPFHLVVVVGKYEESDIIKHRLDVIPNLLILGNRRHEAIPSYLKMAHVTIIPYLCNELNRSVYPLKLNEYLAMGKPVVSTKFSPDLDSFADLIYISSNYEQFLEGVELALLENDPQKGKNRVRVAAQNSWEKRVIHLQSLIKQYSK